MNDIRNVSRAGKNTRRIQQSTITRAVRSVLAASALTLALGATSGTASAAAHRVPVAHALQLQRAAIDFAPVDDLALIPGGAETLIPGGGGPVMSLVSGWSGTFPGNVSGGFSGPFSATSAVDDATGIYLGSTGGSATATLNAGSSATGTTTAGAFDAIGIDVYAFNSGTVNNNGTANGIALGNGTGTGIHVYAYNGDATVNNTGTAYGYSKFGSGYGIVAVSNHGDATVNNSGDVTGYAYLNGVGMGIYAASTDGNVTINNTGAGNVYAYSWGNFAIGAYGHSVYGDVSVDNQADIYAHSVRSSAVGVYTNSTYGDINVSNSGTILVNGRTYSAGVTATGTGGVTVTNSATGDIHVTGAAGSGSTAVGISAVSINSDPYAASHVGVYNDGTIYVRTTIGSATGISATATGGTGTVDVVNTGDMYVRARAYSATGINAWGDDGVNVTNDATGSLVALSPSGHVTGIAAFSPYGDTTVSNSGYVAALGNKYSSTGINAGSQYGNVSVTNSGAGEVYAFNRDATATGVNARSYAGNVGITNGDTGYIHAVSTNGDAIAVQGYSHDGNASVSNGATGNIYAYSRYGDATGNYVVSYAGNAVVDNSGTVGAYSYYGTAIGIIAGTLGAGDVTINVMDTGVVNATGYDQAIGVGGIAMGTGDVNIYVAGAVNATSAQGSAAGVVAQAAGGSVNITSADTGAITVHSYDNGMGVMAVAAVNVDIDNATDVYVNAAFGNAFGLYANSGGTTTVTNSGAVGAYAPTHGYFADGIFAYGATTNVTNTATGAITVYGHSWSAGIEAGATGAATVTNDGAVSSYSYHAAYGIYAYGDTVTVTNNGDVTAMSDNAAPVFSTLGVATGVYAYGANGATVTNSATGTIHADGYYGATGVNVVVANPGATATVNNAGMITAYGYLGVTTGISTAVTGTGGTSMVTNTGDISVNSHNKYNAYGVNAFADGDSTVTNAAGASIYAYSYGSAYGVLSTSFNGHSVITNAGDIDVKSMGALQKYSYGALAFGVNGDASVSNTGSISVHSKYYSTGIMASGLTGATVTNGATGSVVADGWKATGIYAVSANGDVSVSNAGDILATYTYAPAAAKSAYGVKAVSTNGDVLVTNAATGNIDATLLYGGLAVGAFGYSGAGSATVYNYGHIGASTVDTLATPASAVGAAAFTGGGDGANVGNAVSGDITAASVYGNAFGARANASGGGNATVQNFGDISATSTYATAIGALSQSALADAVVINAGGLNATGMVSYGASAMGYGMGAVVNNGSVVSLGDAIAVGVYAASYGLDSLAYVSNTNSVYSHAGLSAGMSIAASANNTNTGNAVVLNSATGTINATGGILAIGVSAHANDGDVTVTNAGAIHAQAYGSPGAVAIAVAMSGTAGTNTLNNLAGGVIQAYGANTYAYAVTGDDGVDVINNAGTITGDVLTYAGDDKFNNLAGGIWNVAGTMQTDFGDDDDSLSNSGTIWITNGSIGFGNGDDTATNNANGLINLSNGLIHMDAGTNTFTNAGKINVLGHVGNTIDAGAAGTVFNNGLIEMNTGFTNEALTVASTFGGTTGHLSIDVHQVGLTADHLFVNGNVLANTKQTVDINLAPVFPLTAHTSIPFAWVTGTSAAGNFVPGTIYGYNYPLNFIDLGFTIGSNINTANTASDVFSVNLDVNGLNDTGAIAALTAQGAANFMNTQMGTFRQRLGVNPYGDAGKVMSAYVRYYSTSGDVTPGHLANNFGQGGHFNFDQSTWGYEVGVNANLMSNLHVGVVLGNADSRQRLNDGGVGTNRMDGMTFGGYMTWYVPSGWYLDLTARKMAADVYSTSVAGTLANRIHTNSVSLEGGYEFKVGNINIVPQLQYTWTQVDELERPYHGQYVDLSLGGGHYNRGRIGVDFNTQIESGDFRWTPYGSLNWVHNSRGTSDYVISNSYSSFSGSTWVSGSAVLAEFGVGIEKGGWGVTLGGNWTDGGKFDSMFGGQVNVRYSW